MTFWLLKRLAAQIGSECRQRHRKIRGCFCTAFRLAMMRFQTDSTLDTKGRHTLGAADGLAGAELFCDGDFGSQDDIDISSTSSVRNIFLRLSVC